MNSDNTIECFLAAIDAVECGDQEVAAEWYRKTADQGCADAQLNLARMHTIGYGVLKNYLQALKWFRLSAEQGNAEAQYELAFMFHNGVGVKQARAEA